MLSAEEREEIKSLLRRMTPAQLEDAFLILQFVQEVPTEGLTTEEGFQLFEKWKANGGGANA